MTKDTKQIILGAIVVFIVGYILLKIIGGILSFVFSPFTIILVLLFAGGVYFGFFKKVKEILNNRDKVKIDVKGKDKK